jgi:head-tail adaptor
MLAGRMNYKVTVLRRAVVPGNPGGDPRGEFAVAFATRATLKQSNGFRRADAGLLEDQSAIVLRVYSSAAARTVTIADRLRLEGPGLTPAEWSVEAVSVPDAARRHIEITALRRIGG